MHENDRENELRQKFTVEFTKEEGMLLLTSARLLDKLVAGVTIHARERDEIIKDIIRKLSQSVSVEVAHVANELADAIVDSVLGCDEMDDDYALISDALSMSLSEEDYLKLRREVVDNGQLSLLGDNVGNDGCEDFLVDKGRELKFRDDEFFGGVENNFDLQEFATFDTPPGDGNQNVDRDQMPAGNKRFEGMMRDSQIDYPMYHVDKTLPILEKALVNHHSVQANYYSFARESVDKLTLNPLVMLKEGNLWRMVAYCRERGEILLFRVDRIKDISETTELFEAPADAGKITYTRLPAYS